jgi:hypothetical protein
VWAACGPGAVSIRGGFESELDGGSTAILASLCKKTKRPARCCTETLWPMALWATAIFECQRRVRAPPVG